MLEMVTTPTKPRRFTIADLLEDGPPVRLRDLEDITGLSRRTLLREVSTGTVRSVRRSGRENVHIRVERDEAARWLRQLGFKVN